MNRASSYAPPLTGADSDTTLWSYSLDREPVREERPDGRSVERLYDSAGRLSVTVVPGGTVERTYYAADDLLAPGKLASVTSSLDSVTVAYGYSGALLSTTTFSGAISGTVSRTFSNDDQVATESVAADPVPYTYGDADGLLTQAGLMTLTLDPATALRVGTALERLRESLGYNGFGELASYETSWLDPSHNPVPAYAISLDRDALGRIVRKTETVGSAVPVAHEYSFDDAGRLAEVYEGNGPCDTHTCVLVGTYGYDDNGNRTLGVAGDGIPRSASYDAQDRMLSYGTASYAYTRAGELTEKHDSATNETTSYNYDVLGALRTVALPDGRLVEYVIDGLGRRVGKKVDGILERGWLYRDALAPVAEVGSDGFTVVARFVYASNRNVPDYMVKGGSTYRIITDHLGSVRLVVWPPLGLLTQAPRGPHRPWPQATPRRCGGMPPGGGA